MKIRQIRDEDRLTTSTPLHAYAFGPSPVPTDELERQAAAPVTPTDDVTLVAEEGSATVATVTAVPMRQNVRGRVYRMAGIAGVATHPLARRRGHVRTLLTELLARMREEGRAERHASVLGATAPRTRT